jgi:hypothetical protein
VVERTRPSVRLAFIRSLAFGSLFEVFLICAVASLLAIRGLLALAGFPSISGGGLHIAHLLWGGLLMLLALLLLTAFIGRPIQYLAVTLAGIGFGTFIDEVGKFVTSDDNYFFRPAVAIAYVVLVVVVLFARFLEGRRRLTDAELLANSFELAREARTLGRRPAGTARALAFLRVHATGDPMVAALRDELEEAMTRAALLPGPLARVRRAALHAYVSVVESRVLVGSLLVAMVGYLALSAAIAAAVVRYFVPAPESSFRGSGGVALAGVLLAFALTTALLMVALSRLRQSLADAYGWFERAVLVNLLLGQVFIFYLIQFWALFAVGADLLLLLLLRGLIRAERAVERHHC